MPFFCMSNVDLTCGAAWRGPCASTDRDRTDRQVQICVRHQATVVHSMVPIIAEISASIASVCSVSRQSLVLCFPRRNEY